MVVFRDDFEISTKGHTDIIDISGKVNEIVKKSGVKEGILNVFVAHSTAGITTVEYEPGLIKDLKEAMERVAPTGITYHHDSAWGDGNGYAHIRSSIVGAGFSCPVSGGSPITGTWQQIVLLDFDNRARNRKVIVTVIGE
ncbi:MAG TPA: YjbQ family protein [Firmicutes bacterium]|nr:MAG: YjbQ family protein [Candidatus Coatesbacteria bacterium]HDM43162.1 YjbQ family protein [Bacillota bacterium]